MLIVCAVDGRPSASKLKFAGVAVNATPLPWGAIV
jgi:hypothetical protein